MINSRGVGAATAMALILVLAEPTHGLAQYRINERNERPSVPPRPPMRMVQPGPIVAPKHCNRNARHACNGLGEVR